MGDYCNRVHTAHPGKITALADWPDHYNCKYVQS